VTGRKLALIPLLGATAAAAALHAAPTATADCSSGGYSGLCTNYDPYPCAVVDPVCGYYDTYDPGAVFDQPNWGFGGFGGFGGAGGVGGIGGIGPR